MKNMNKFKINFLLNKPDNITPWGEKQKSLSWFILTDGLLWINAGESVIYEYSEYARKSWNCDIKYNDYYISRFLEDFSELLRFICEPVPIELYENIETFKNMTEKWKNLHINDPDEIFNEFYFGEFYSLTEWYYNRTMDSSHLIGGPHIEFFRCGDMLKILWDSDYLLENGQSIWTCPYRVYELPYSDFINEVKEFFNRFYCDMDKQVEYTISKEWKNINTDKNLVSENISRKQGFNQEINLLFSENYKKTDFNQILSLYNKMRSEINE